MKGEEEGIGDMDGRSRGGDDEMPKQMVLSEAEYDEVED